MLSSMCRNTPVRHVEVLYLDVSELKLRHVKLKTSTHGAEHLLLVFFFRSEKISVICVCLFAFFA